MDEKENSGFGDVFGNVLQEKDCTVAVHNPPKCQKSREVIEGASREKKKTKGPYAKIVAITWHVDKINPWQNDHYTKTAKILSGLKCSYIAMCLEPTDEGKPHLQIMAVKTTGKGFDLGTMSKRLAVNTPHCRKAVNPLNLENYCLHREKHKDKPQLDDPVTWGTRPTDQWLTIHQGTRTDLVNYAADIASGMTTGQLALKHLGITAQYRHLEGKIRESLRPEPIISPYPFKLPGGQQIDDPNPLIGGFDIPTEKRHFWIWGPTDTRKSGWLREQFGGKRVFPCKASKYPYEGYKQEEVIIWNMLKPTFQELEGWSEWNVDDVHVPGDTRYTATMMHGKIAKTCVVTSNYAPEYGTDQAAFEKRFFVIYIEDIIPLKILKQKPAIVIGDIPLGPSGPRSHQLGGPSDPRTLERKRMMEEGHR